MKVLIKNYDYVSNQNKIVGQFHIDKTEWIAFLLSPKGKKILKQIVPKESGWDVNHPHILKLINLMYDMLSDPKNENPETDFYITNPPLSMKKSYTKIFLEIFLPHQLSLEKVTK